MKYSDKLRDPRWQKKRLKILERDNWTCKYCGATDRTLHVHHNEYNGDPWNANDEKLDTVCDICHDMFHKYNSDLEIFLYILTTSLIKNNCPDKRNIFLEKIATYLT